MIQRALMTALVFVVGFLPFSTKAEARKAESISELACAHIDPSPYASYVVVSVEKPGNWCLRQDLIQRNVYDLITGKNRGSPGVSGVANFIRVCGARLDLAGHLVTGDPFENTLGVSTTLNVCNLELRRGNIRVKGPWSVGVAMGPVYVPGRRLPDFESPLVHVSQSEIPRSIYTYESPTLFKLDDLNIRSGSVSVILRGAQNTLRNSTLETDGPVAAYLYGPGAVIENNTFIIHAIEAEGIKLPAALKLMDADGAVIRNNRFIVKGWFKGKAEAAINLIRSKNVVIENNVIEDARTLVRKDEVSSTIERGNQLP